MKHHPTCRADYPEKPEGELPQQIVEIDISTHDDLGQTLVQCSDCGAYEVVKKCRECERKLDDPTDELSKSAGGYCTKCLARAVILGLIKDEDISGASKKKPH